MIAFNKTEYKEVPLTERLAPLVDNIVPGSFIRFRGIKSLKGLNPSKALGPDELHPRVLKELANKLGPIFSHVSEIS